MYFEALLEIFVFICAHQEDQGVPPWLPQGTRGCSSDKYWIHPSLLPHPGLYLAHWIASMPTVKKCHTDFLISTINIYKEERIPKRKKKKDIWSRKYLSLHWRTPFLEGYFSSFFLHQAMWASHRDQCHMHEMLPPMF